MPSLWGCFLARRLSTPSGLSFADTQRRAVKPAQPSRDGQQRFPPGLPRQTEEYSAWVRCRNAIRSQASRLHRVPLHGPQAILNFRRVSARDRSFSGGSVMRQPQLQRRSRGATLTAGWKTRRQKHRIITATILESRQEGESVCLAPKQDGNDQPKTDSFQKRESCRFHQNKIPFLMTKYADYIQSPEWDSKKRAFRASRLCVGGCFYLPSERIDP